MTLGGLISALEDVDPRKAVRYGFRRPHSYRGDYADLAFEPTMDVKIGDMLKAARSALGAHYEGYKGGLFPMHEFTLVHLAHEGSVGNPIDELLLQFILGRVPDARHLWDGALPEGADDV